MEGIIAMWIGCLGGVLLWDYGYMDKVFWGWKSVGFADVVYCRIAGMGG